ncbi:MAG: hypothetical protein OHK93_006767 [Ramalina farinacea]|uniref:Conserved oligomeric Golgi complex subunit 8 n=1 Tax=Ramalina farinacea TaxID=258253 RepID=A0AA43QJ76_9LECA|nr:hypothetical protein [Ramalina farinacea]
MGDALYELLQPYLSSSSTTNPHPSPNDPTASKYLSRLSTLPLTSLTSTEPQSLRQSTHSNLLSLQSLAARSNAALVASSSHLSSLRTALPTLSSQSTTLRDFIPDLDTTTLTFSEKYSRRSTSENTVLDRRKTALLLSRNADRLADIFELPTLLTSAIASASSSTSAAGAQTTTTTTTTNYASALDLYSHIKRLHLLYPTSPLIGSIYAQSEVAMQGMTASLITSLRAPNIKLAAAMRTVGWLRRVAPDLVDDNEGATTTNTTAANLSSTTTIGGGNRGEGYLGALFLVCRLATLVSTLSALEPLQDLADQETEMRVRDNAKGAATKQKSRDAWSSGQQTERYLKRYIEIFREQSFGIVGMFRSIFPPAAVTARQYDGAAGEEELGGKLRGMGMALKGMQMEGGEGAAKGGEEDLLSPLPSALATFPMHLVGMLEETLRRYLPNVRDKASRESLLTQVLYCARSLGRLGGDFSLMLADLSVGGQGDGEDDEDEDDAEWVAVMKKHRVLAGKLEKMASGVATTT